MSRLADRLLALVLAAVAIALARTDPLQRNGAFAWQGFSGLLAGAAFLRLMIFSLAALSCLIGALLFWTGLLPGRPAHAAGAPLFGRAAEVPDTGRPGLRKAFLVLPLVVIMALAGDRFGPWHGGRRRGCQLAQRTQGERTQTPRPQTR